MVKIVWTNKAKCWLKHIFDYISVDNPTAAKKVISGIYEQVDLLKAFPEIGFVFKKNNNQDIRIIMYGHYRIAYLIKDKNHIDILAILHGKMDIKEYLKKNE
ncbi:MAG: type II toxin-antitoxin system RelE/ParE family toxin [Gammaproteobacteria bacterium]|nr:MAG: type II toxin-antitoxin system RelE/ParE family toxin [Gammaproteobacteria bacterium]